MNGNNMFSIINLPSRNMGFFFIIVNFSLSLRRWHVNKKIIDFFLWYLVQFALLWQACLLLLKRSKSDENANLEQSIKQYKTPSFQAVPTYLLSDRSVLFPTNIIMTSLPLSVRTSSIHFDVCWKEFASAKKW